VTSSAVEAAFRWGGRCSGGRPEGRVHECQLRPAAPAHRDHDGSQPAAVCCEGDAQAAGTQQGDDVAVADRPQLSLVIEQDPLGGQRADLVQVALSGLPLLLGVQPAGAQ